MDTVIQAKNGDLDLLKLSTPFKLAEFQFPKSQEVVLAKFPTTNQKNSKFQ